MAFYPKDAPACNDASNNQWLVTGKGALIMNPQSTWAAAAWAEGELEGFMRS